MMKGQAALEFMTTYGWMILVTAMVGGAIAYYGVFDQDRLVPPQCTFTMDFKCERYSIRDTGQVNVELSNKIGEPIIVDSFTCEYESGGTSDDTVLTTTPATLNPGDSHEFTCHAGEVISDRKTQVKVIMNYRKVNGGFTKTVQGQINANVFET